MRGYISRHPARSGGSLTRILLLTLLPLLSTTALAAQIEGTRVPCPDGSGEVIVNRLVAQNGVGGWDSDGARYGAGGQFREKSVSTCPSGLSLYGADMARGLSPAMREDMRGVIADIQRAWKDRDVTELPAHVRHSFAARIYTALGQHDKAIQLWLSASWLARDRGVGLFKGLDGPAIAQTMLLAGEQELKKDLDPAVRKQLTFNLAVVATRAGEADVRDRWLAAMEGLDLTAEERARVERLKNAIQLEATYQDRAIQAIREALPELRGASKVTATYQLADLLRRRGQPDAARPLYTAVADSEDAPDLLRELARYFTKVYAGEEPWTSRRFQQLGQVEPEP